MGHKAGRRRLVDWRAAFAAYAECDARAQPEREAYLSHFVFGRDFADHLEREGTEKGYSGPCGADWLFWDIDRPDDLALALRDARRLAGAILDRYRELDDDDLLIFLSGGKGVHVGIPTVWHPEPSPHFNVDREALLPGDLAEAGEARRRWLDLLEDAALPGAELQAPEDRALQAPALARRTDAPEAGSRSSSWLGIPSRSRFPAGPALCLSAADDWSESPPGRRATGGTAVEHPATATSRLTAFLRRFIRDGELEPDRRAVSTFRAAAELGELYESHGFDALAHALLTEAALDSGLSPSEAKRQIDCGLAHGRRPKEGGAA